MKNLIKARKETVKKIFVRLWYSKMLPACLLVIISAAGTQISLKAETVESERRSFTVQQPADYVTFNSITDSLYGDERNFVQIREVGQSNSNYTDEIKLMPGKEYKVYIFFNNNAASELNKYAYDTSMSLIK